jgi:hypothetical protein
MGGWVGGHTIHQAYLPLQGFLPLIDLQSERAIFLFLCRRCWESKRARERAKEKKQHPDKIARHFFWDLAAISLLISQAPARLLGMSLKCAARKAIKVASIAAGVLCAIILLYEQIIRQKMHLLCAPARSAHTLFHTEWKWKSCWEISLSVWWWIPNR